MNALPGQAKRRPPMRIHHLNCISTCPLGAGLFERHARGLRGRLACHCLLIETASSLVLVDTGFGLRDVADPFSRLSRSFLSLLAPDLREEMTAIRQIERLGFDPRDVGHIVLSHLDFDHAGGLDDFPHARVHMLQAERVSAQAQRSLLDRMRYRPQQWSYREQWRGYPLGSGEAWLGFEHVVSLDGVTDDVLLVPLVGHTLGHAGIAVRRSDGWLFMTGDAYFHHGEMDLDRPHCPIGLRIYQWMMEKNRTLRLANQARLRQLKLEHGEAVQIVSSHDVVEFERLAGRPLVEPPREPLREDRGFEALASRA
jgi:glyoxylase-like metal-dependent hydrolase (beta-lactamase superfamily II)